MYFLQEGSNYSLSLLIEPGILNKKVVNNILFIILWIGVPFLLYTKGKTKISWYILPIYPGIAVSIGAAVSILLRSPRRNFILQTLLSLALLLAVYKNEKVILSARYGYCARID
jgi:hypothetical protein